MKNILFSASTLLYRVLAFTIACTYLFLVFPHTVKAGDFKAIISPNLNFQAFDNDRDGQIASKFDPGDKFTVKAEVKNESQHFIRLTMVDIEQILASRLFSDAVFSFRKNGNVVYTTKPDLVNNYISDIIPPQSTVYYDLDFVMPSQIGNEDQGLEMKFLTKINFSLADPPPSPTPSPTPSPGPSPGSNSESSSSNQTSHDQNLNFGATRARKSLGNLIISSVPEEPLEIEKKGFEKEAEKENFTFITEGNEMNNCCCNQNFWWWQWLIIVILLIIMCLLQYRTLKQIEKKDKNEKYRR